MKSILEEVSMTKADNNSDSNGNIRNTSLEQQIDDLNSTIRLTTRKMNRNKLWIILSPVMGIIIYEISRMPKLGGGGTFEIGSLTISHAIIGLILCALCFFGSWAFYTVNRKLKTTICEQKEELDKLTGNKK